jgi:hypothetical protein
MLLALWPKASSRAASPETQATEPFAVRGTPGHSVAHARIDLREVAAEAAQAAGANKEEAREEKMPEHVRPWKSMPLPSGARVRREVRPRALSGGAVQVSSPPLASSFQGLLDDGRLIPPDTDGAVGPNHIVTMLNSQVRVHDRGGREIVTTTLKSFWMKVSGDLFVSDPHIEYDPATGRWITSAVAFSFAVKDSSVLVGASQTGDPAGTWNLYRMLADPDTSLLFADFPTLGFNRDWIAVQVNMYGFPQTDPTATQQLLRTQIYAFDKGNILAGGPDSRHTLFALAGFGACQVPAVTYDAGLPVLYLLEMWNGNLNGSGYLRLYAISGPVGSEVLSSVGFPATDDTWDFRPRGNGNFGPQKDAPVDSRTGIPEYVQTGDSDFSHVVFRNGLITASHTVFLPAGGSATRSAVQWWQLTADGAVVQRGRLDDATGQIFYAYSSIAPNRDNDLLLGYTTYTLQQYPSAAYAFRAAGDPVGSLRAGAPMKGGESLYVKLDGSLRNRWGDYSGTAVDPANDTDLWTIQEYAALPPQPAPISWWGTWWGRIVPDSGPPVALPVADFSASAAATLAGRPVVFNDTSAGATQWFWNFGDGTASSDRNPVHVFQYSGTFSVVLTAVNQTGATAATRSITVGEPDKSRPEPVSRDRVPRRVTPRG